jgi:hypothetical protein
MKPYRSIFNEGRGDWVEEKMPEVMAQLKVSKAFNQYTQLMKDYVKYYDLDYDKASEIAEKAKNVIDQEINKVIKKYGFKRDNRIIFVDYIYDELNKNIKGLK